MTGAARVAMRAGRMPLQHVLGAVGGGILSSVSAVGLLATSAWLITRASQRPPVFELSIAIGAVQAFALGRGVARYAERLSVHAIVLESVSRMRVWLYRVVEPLVPDGLGRRGTGGMLNALVGEVDLSADALAKEIAAAIDIGTSIVCGAVIALLIAPSVAIALAGSAAVIVGLVAASQRIEASAADRAAGVRAELADRVVDCVRSARELAVYGREELALRWLEDLSRRSASSAWSAAIARGMLRAGVTIAAGLGLVTVVVIAVGAHVAGRLDGVEVAVLAFVTLAVLDQAGALPGALAGAAEGEAAARRLVTLSRLRPAVREPASDGGPAKGKTIAALDRIEVESPSGAATLLAGVSLRLGPGEHVAIAGASGAGKTTVLHTLLHFLDPSRGTATLDGVNVRDITRPALARHIAWLDEDVHVFAATARDNLRLARPSAGDAECIDALERVGLAAWHQALPLGLDTALGTGGRPLSAGERQRLGLARALLSGADVLLLDEPTAHLDPFDSAEVLSHVLHSAGTRSVLAVTHDANLVRGVDRTITLERGRIVSAPSGSAGSSPRREG